MKCPILWIFGSLDNKAQLIQKRLKSLGIRDQIVEIPHASHRLLQDQVAVWSELI
jgi:hypothetical protein